MRYVRGAHARAHLMRADGRTVCGVRVRGARWQAAETFNPDHDCQRCARATRSGIARLLSWCPKCLLDFGMTRPLDANQTCGNCGSQWL